MKRRTTGALIVTFACLAMLAFAALSVEGCTACFTPGTSQQPCGTYTPRVTPIPHDPPAEPLTPAEPAPEPIPEPEEPTEVEEPIASEPLPPEAGSGPGSTSGPTPPNEGESGPVPTVPPPGPPQFIGCEWETGMKDHLEVGKPCGCAERYDPYEVVTQRRLENGSCGAPEDGPED